MAQDTVASPSTSQQRGTIGAYLRHNVRDYGLLISLIAIMVFFQFMTGATLSDPLAGTLFKPLNLTNIVLQNSYIVIMALGMLLIIVAGHIDLSVGSVFALMPMSFALMFNAGVPFVAAILLGLVICAVIGFVNGYVTIKFAIPSFITTLGMLFMARSLSVVISGGFPPLLSGVPSWIRISAASSPPSRKKPKEVAR